MNHDTTTSSSHHPYQLTAIGNYYNKHDGINTHGMEPPYAFNYTIISWYDKGKG